jgi:hypothetical protein
MTNLMGIVPLSAKTAEVISMASPPVGIKKIMPNHQTPKTTKDFIWFSYLTSGVFPDIRSRPGWILAKGFPLSYTHNTFV